MGRGIALSVRYENFFAALIGAFKATARSRICQRAAIAIFISLTVVNAVLVALLYQQMEQEYRDGARDRVTGYLSSIAGRERLPSIDTIVGLSESLVQTTDLVGGVYVNQVGNVQGIFGKRPDTTWKALQLLPEQDKSHLISDRHIHEFYLSPEQTGLNFGVIVQYDGKKAWEQTRSKMWQFLLLAIAGVFGITGVSVIIVAITIIYPLRQLKFALDLALEEPKQARQYLTGFNKYGEVGSMARAIDRILIMLGDTHFDDQISPTMMMERATNPILIFNADHQVVNANLAAKALFGFDVVADFAEVDWDDTIQVLDECVPLARFYEKEPTELSGFVKAGGHLHGCLISSGRSRVGDEFGCFLVITIADKILIEMRAAREKKSELEGKLEEANRHLKAHKKMLKACLTLMQQAETANKRVAVQPDRLLKDYLKQGGSGRARIKEVRHQVLPPILCDEKDAVDIFDWALTILATRSRHDATIAVAEASVDDNLCQFIIREPENPAAGEDGIGAVEPGADALVLIGGLARLLSQNNGRLEQSGDDKVGNFVGFVLPLGVAGSMPTNTGQNQSRSEQAA